MIPPTGNETISMLKTSSPVTVIAYRELLYSVQVIYVVNYSPQHQRTRAFLCKVL